MLARGRRSRVGKDDRIVIRIFEVRHGSRGLFLLGSPRWAVKQIPRLPPSCQSRRNDVEMRDEFKRIATELVECGRQSVSVSACCTRDLRVLE